MSTNNGDQFFGIEAYKWQYHKIKVIRSKYPQNSIIITPDGFTYRIISYRGTFSIDFITLEIRFGFEPVTEQFTQIVQNITISIADSANINLNLNNSIDYSSVHNEIKNKVADVIERDELLDYIESISNGDTVSKESTSRFYNLLKKYEPVLSCASSLISAISSIISTIM